MDKLEGENFGFATYDPKCPFDMAQHLLDEAEHRGADLFWTRDLLTWIMHDHYFSDFGKEYVKAFDLISRNGAEATNKGVPQSTIDFYIRYYNWLVENNFGDFKKTKAWNTVFKMYINNHNERDFFKFPSIELVKKRFEEYEAKNKIIEER